MNEIPTTFIAFCDTCRVCQCFSSDYARQYWVENHPHVERND